MKYRSNARAVAPFGCQQHRMAAAGFSLMLGMIADAGRGRMPRRPLMDGAIFLRFLGERIVEVMRDRLFDLLVLRDDPHHEEKGHHRRHEVGIRHFPSAATFASHGKGSGFGVQVESYKFQVPGFRFTGSNLKPETWNLELVV